ncbi:hypothetical protein N7466_008204 [Penicillium verhagenii]|uniref:uncharacterized protein n=1 Tax=Penicillium verhagenii TaxID=1562060 RepID=UPI0025455F5D|nr:uncharacterized protein N7466_008204 [Penicillium verhagenii]KAJ5924017.1 hypothetical protein N7466_008204 [Penicillium verhagenii]
MSRLYQTSNAGKSREILPKLKGTENWHEWLEELRTVVEPLGNDLLEIMQGEITEPNDGLYLVPPSEADVCKIIADRKSIKAVDPKTELVAATKRILPESISEAEIARYLEYHFERPNDRLKQWKINNADAYSIISHSCTADTKMFIAGTRSAAEALEILKARYGQLNQNEFNRVFQTFATMEFRQGSDPVEFVVAWRAALNRLFAADKEYRFGRIIQYGHFMVAVRNNPDCYLWEQLNPQFDHTRDDLMPTVFRSFLNYMALQQRKATNA